MSRLGWAQWRPTVRFSWPDPTTDTNNGVQAFLYHHFGDVSRLPDQGDPADRVEGFNKAIQFDADRAAYDAIPRSRSVVLALALSCSLSPRWRWWRWWRWRWRWWLIAPTPALPCSALLCSALLSRADRPALRSVVDGAREISLEAAVHDPQSQVLCCDCAATVL